MHFTIRIRGFKSVGDVTLTLRQGVNILIGPNGAGKSNILGALQLLGDTLTRGAGLAVARAGGWSRVYRKKRRRVEFLIEASYGPRTHLRTPKPHVLKWRIVLGFRTRDRVSEIVHERIEILADTGREMEQVFVLGIRRPSSKSPSHLFHAASPSVSGKNLFSNLSRLTGRTRKAETYEVLSTRLEQLLKAARRDSDTPLLRHVATFDTAIYDLMSRFINLGHYDILPDHARASSEQTGNARMLPDGGDVAEVLSALEVRDLHRITMLGDLGAVYLGDHWRGVYYSGYRPRYRRLHPGRLQEVFSRINEELSVAVEPIDRVSVSVEATTGRSYVQYWAGDAFFYPDEVSDGTVKWLCLLVSVLVPAARTYLIEEPENFLHPWMQQRLIKIMRDQAEESGTIFILTSHSATVLNAAQAAEVILVTPSSEGSVVTSVAKKKELVTLLKESHFGLGDLWVSGLLGAVPGEQA